MQTNMSYQDAARAIGNIANVETAAILEGLRSGDSFEVAGRLYSPGGKYSVIVKDV